MYMTTKYFILWSFLNLWRGNAHQGGRMLCRKSLGDFWVRFTQHPVQCQQNYEWNSNASPSPIGLQMVCLRMFSLYATHFVLFKCFSFFRNIECRPNILLWKSLLMSQLIFRNYGQYEPGIKVTMMYIQVISRWYKYPGERQRLPFHLDGKAQRPLALPPDPPA